MHERDRHGKRHDGRDGRDAAARRERLSCGESRRATSGAARVSFDLVLLFALLVAPVALRAQSGRNRAEPTPSPSPGVQRPRRAAPTRDAVDAPQGQPASPASPSRAGDTQTPQGSPAPTSAAPKTSESSPTDVDDDEVYKVDSNLVPVSANVTDATGRAIADLKLEDFELRVDGQPKPISDLSHAETPVRIALLFDNSSSIRPTRELEKRAAMNFFRTVIRPVDQAAIFSISTIPTLDQPLTNEVPKLVRTIERYGEVEGSTALFDTIVMAADYLRPQPGRKVMIIVSDGVETTSNLQDFGEMVRRVLASDCQVFVIQTGLSDNANLRDLVAERRMQDLTSYTGGFVNVPKLPSDLEVAFTQIAADLSQQYVLSYYPNDDARDGRFRVITLRVKSRPNVRVRARRGYYPRRHDNLSSLQPSDTNAVAPYAIRDPVVTMPVTAPSRETASSDRGVAANANARAPVNVNVQTHGSKNLDPDAGETPVGNDASARPTVRLGSFNPQQSPPVDQPAENAHASPTQTKNPAADAANTPAEASRTQPATAKTQTDNSQPNPSQSSTFAPTSDAAATTPAPKESDKTQTRDSESSLKDTSPPASTTGAQSSSQHNSSPSSTPSQSSPQTSTRASSTPTAQPPSSTQAVEPPKKIVVSGGVLNSRAKTLPLPLYPETAKRMRVAGIVTVEVTIDESGKVVEARAASGPALLRDAAVNAARQARFSPTLVSGQPVQVTGVINYTFTL